MEELDGLYWFELFLFVHTFYVLYRCCKFYLGCNFRKLYELYE